MSLIEDRSIRAEADGYDDARRVWNGAIQRRPQLIVVPRDTSEVVEGLAYARSHALSVSVRGGGHGVSGRGVMGDVVMDLKNLAQVSVDLRSGLVRVGGGATWSDVDAATQQYALAIPGGVMSRTGVGGLTLGGGLGWLRRAFGLSSDVVTAFEAVTSSGEIVQVRADQHADLYWALRGGGRNVVVVTAFTFRASALDPTVMFAQTYYDADDANAVLAAYREFAESAPDEVTTSVIVATVPPIDAFAAESHGRTAVMLAGLYAGPASDGAMALAPLQEAGGARPIADFSGPRPYVEVQRGFDALYPDGRQYYWSSLFLDDLTDDALGAALDSAAKRPSPLSAVAFWQLGGAIDRLPRDATAYEHRGAGYLMGVEANWDEVAPESRHSNVAWVKDCTNSVLPFSTGGQYVNLASAGDGTSDSSVARKLRATQSTYDPIGLFAER